MRTVVHFLTLIAAPGLCLVFAFLLVVQLIAPTVLTGLDTRITASIAALLFAVFSFFYRSVEKETQSRKQHTINILFTTRLSPEFRQHLEHRKHCFAEGTDIDPDIYTAYLDATRTVDISDDEANRRRRSAEAVRSLLNYYEFIALGIKSADLDESMLRGMIRGNVCRLVRDARLVIRRYQSTEPRTFEHLTSLYRAWKDAADPDI